MDTDNRMSLSGRQNKTGSGLLAQEILLSAKPSMMGSNTLTPEDQALIGRMVEAEVQSAYMDFSPDEDRSQFKMDRECLDGVIGAITVETFPGKPLKQVSAIRYAQGLVKAWEGYIRKSPLLKMILTSSERFSKEVRQI